MNRMSATYSPEDNKLRLSSVNRLSPELYARVKAAGFGWAPRQEIFVAPKWTPEREDLLLELCGEIDDEDTSLVERAEERAERFGGYRENRTADAESARVGVAAIADNIPFGQPILVGHHSERHARRDAERIENGMRRAVKMWATAEYWKHRAAGAIRHAKYKERPDVRHRRIKGLESEMRGYTNRIKVSELMLKLWGQPDLTLKAALTIANTDHIHLDGGTLWGLLDRDGITAAEAAVKAIALHTRITAVYARWVAHLTNRLTYERAMLGEWTPPAKPKTKSDLPLLNYSGEVAYRNPWRAGEITRVQAVGVTKAALAAIHADYKGTRLSECGTHRVRVAVLADHLRIRGNAGLTAVYVTDSKQHERPTPAVVAEQAEAEARARMAAPVRVAAARAVPDEQAALFTAMGEALRAGVQVVSVPQLFPTPGPLAARMVDLAEIAPGHTVLEPSAGTGALLDAVRAAGFFTAAVTAVEINEGLADRLRLRFDDVKQADFLACDRLGTFDRVLMNPPFEHGADIKHVLHARSLLNPGGRLVAICAGGPRQEAVLRPLAATWEELPAGTFAGTGVRAVLLTIEAGA